MAAADPRGADFDEKTKPLHLRPAERALPEWLWGDKIRHTVRTDSFDVITTRSAHWRALQAIVWFEQFLSDTIIEREISGSVPSLKLFLPSMSKGIPDLDLIQAVVDASTTEGLRTTRQLVAEILRPQVVRAFIRSSRLTHHKKRKLGTFASHRGRKDEYLNRMRIRVPHA